MRKRYLLKVSKQARHAPKPSPHATISPRPIPEAGQEGKPHKEGFVMFNKQTLQSNLDKAMQSENRAEAVLEVLGEAVIELMRENKELKEKISHLSDSPPPSEPVRQF